MKKQVLALAITAVASASAFAEVENTIYGSLRLKLNTGDSTTDISNDLSRIGLKGSSSTDIDGVKAIYRFEAGVDGGDSSGRTAEQNEAFLNSRLAWVGLTSADYGTLKVGQMWTNYYSMLTAATDLMYSISGETQPYARADSAVAYVSPDLGGLTITAAMTADKDQSTGKEGDAERYMITASYVAGPMTINVGTAQEAAKAADDAIGLSVAYSADALYLAALIQNMKSDLDGADSRTPFELAGSYSFDDVNSIAVTYFDADDDIKTGYNVEFYHKLGEASTLYADLETTMVDGGDDTTDYALGLKVDF